MSTRSATIKVTSQEQRVYRSQTPERPKSIFPILFVLIASGMIFLALFALLVHQDIIKMYPKGTSADSLKSFASRVEYAVRYQVLLIAWLIFNIFIIMQTRFQKKAFNPLTESTEQGVESYKNILTNSFEQIFISVVSQLIFVSYAEPAVVLKFIPYINVAQIIGRITFFVGYPMRRAFGFCCTMLPNILLTAYNLYKFGSFLGLY